MNDVSGHSRRDDDNRFAFEFETELAAPASEVWAHATTFSGVNRELAPLARMTAPPSLQRLDASAVVPGTRLVRSWILAFGLVPVDYDDVTIVEIEDGRFLERSPMLSQRLWEHERTVTPSPGGCIVRDRVRFEPRIRWLGTLQLPAFRLTFANRHRRLAAIFGRPAA
jgi:ligand-binding SRPBCC domain-containing protein